MLNGRASTKFGDTEIPVKEMLINWSKEFLLFKFPMINVEKDLEFHYNLSNQSSPGKTDEKNSDKGTRKYWFEPRGLYDLQELKKLVSNDTSMDVEFKISERNILDIFNLETQRCRNCIIRDRLLKLMKYKKLTTDVNQPTSSFVSRICKPLKKVERSMIKSQIIEGFERFI